MNQKTIPWTFAVLTIVLFVVPIVGAHGGSAFSVPVNQGSGAPLRAGTDAGLLLHGDGAPVAPVSYERAWSLPPWEGDSSHQFEFDCPPVNETVYTLAGCPAFILDPEDIMSQPEMVIDPVEPGLIAFHALHGGRGVQSLPGQYVPSDRSRDDSLHQPHTVFQKDRADDFIFNDRKYYSPWHCDATTQQDINACQDQPDIFGEDNAIALDGQARMTVASLYAIEQGGDTGQFEYKIVVWKSERMNRLFEDKVNYAVLSTASPLNGADSLDLVYTGATNRMAVVWRESVPDNNTGPTGLNSWVSLSYTKPGEGARWLPLEQEQWFGPCDAVSNAVSVRHLIYVACKPGDAFEYPDPNATLGQWQLFTIDSRDWTTAWHSAVPVTAGDNAKLADSGQDHIIFASAGLDESGNPVTMLSAGTYSGEWYTPNGFGAQLTNQSNPLERREVRITAVAYREETGHVHVLYMERYRVSAGVESAGVPEYYKALANLGVTGRGMEWLGKQPLSLGNGPRHFSAQYQGAGENVFNDLKDSIVVWKDERGNEREFVAYADYGNVRFAEVVEVQQSPFPGFLPVGGAPPIPLAAPGANPAYVGVVAGALSAAMVARILAAKKKATVEAPSL